MFSSEVISSFNEIESALYRYIMENSEKVVYMRIRDLADAAHISTSSVLRFCRKVNCEGFSEFKVKLKMYLEAEQTPSLKSTQHFL
ncbi:RpiR family transcriptional regulator, partial [Enterobacter cloacae]